MGLGPVGCEVWSFGALLKFFILPLLVMHATLSTSSKEAPGGTGDPGLTTR